MTQIVAENDFVIRNSVYNIPPITQNDFLKSDFEQKANIFNNFFC